MAEQSVKRRSDRFEEESSRMRIVVLCANHSLGDERVVAKQALSVARMGHHVTVYGREDPGKWLPASPNLALKPLPLMTRGASFRSRTQRLRALFRLYRLAKTTPSDIMVAHEPDSALVAILARTRNGAKIHFDVHEYFEGMLCDRAPKPLRSLAMWIGQRVMGFLVRRADWITTVSSEIAEHLRAHQPSAPIDVLYNSGTVEHCPVCDHQRPGPLLVCHEGWLDYGTGMVPLLKAVALARRRIDLKLVLVGKVRPWSENAFNVALRELDLSEVVECRGWVPYEKLSSVVSECQVGVVAMQPSLNNFAGLSNKLMSYMACGQAVIVPRGSASAGIVQQFRCGLAVDSTVPEQISEALVRLGRNVHERQQMGQNARRAMEQHFGWHVMEDLLRSRYSQLASRVPVGIALP
jgi:glycosyltransferase involved in cell wall biosynthesis